MTVGDLELKLVRPQPRRQGFGRGSHLFRLAQGALPYRRHTPSVFEKFPSNKGVPRNIRVELRPPELRPGRWGGGIAAPLVSVPEAAVHEDHRVVLRQNEVRPPVDLAGMKPEAETTRMQGPPECQLGFRVLSPYSGHHPGTGLLVHDIDHLRPGFRA